MIHRMTSAEKILLDKDLGIGQWIEGLNPQTALWVRAEIKRIVTGERNQEMPPGRADLLKLIPSLMGRKFSLESGILLSDFVDAALPRRKRNEVQEQFDEFSHRCHKLARYFLSESEIQYFLDRWFERCETLTEDRIRASFRESFRNLQRLWSQTDTFRNLSSQMRKKRLAACISRRVRNLGQVSRLVTDEIEASRVASRHVPEALVSLLLRCGQCVRDSLGKIGKIADAGQLIRGYQSFYAREPDLREATAILRPPSVLYYTSRTVGPRLQVVVSEGHAATPDFKADAFLLLLDPLKRLIWFDCQHAHYFRKNGSINKTDARIPEYLSSTWKLRSQLLRIFPKDFTQKPPKRLPESMFLETLGRVRLPLIQKLELTLDWKAVATKGVDSCHELT